LASSRERLKKTLNHESTDKVVLDLGSTVVTGIAASTLSKLRKALDLDEKPVRVHEPFQILGLIENDLRKVLGIDIASILPLQTFFGYKNEDFKPWQLQDGTDVLVGRGFSITVDEQGYTYIYPKGHINVRPSAKMPKGGYYFDGIVRQEPIDNSNLDPRTDFADDYVVLSDEILNYIERETADLYDNTDYGIIGDIFMAPLGDFALLPGMANENPKGIRDVNEWMIAHKTNPNYIKEVLNFHTEIALRNLELYRQAVGNKIQVIPISGTDFGTQRSELISIDMYREFYKPFHKRINKWVHKNTNWKTFFHTCGSVINLLDEFIDAEIDIINPVQASASGMDLKYLKEEYGNKLVFWGGGIDTQSTLPFGTPEEVKQEVLQRLSILSESGGYVFSTIHNIQPKTPIENIIAMFEAIKEYNKRN
jgi:hypothetical protein